MKNQIDFLQEFKKKESTAKKVAPILNKIIILLIIGYLLIGGGVLTLFFYYQNENNQLQNKIEQKKKRIVQLEKVESLQVLIKERLSALTKILDEKRLDYPEIFSYFENLGKEKNLIFNKIEIEENGLIRVSGRVADRILIIDFLEELEKNQNPFSEITLNSLAKNKEGGYDFSLTFKKSLEK